MDFREKLLKVLNETKQTPLEFAAVLQVSIGAMIQLYSGRARPSKACLERFNDYCKKENIIFTN